MKPRRRHECDYSLSRAQWHHSTDSREWWDSGGDSMSNVLSLKLARERAWQSAWNPETTELDGGGSASNQRLLERLEAENAQLRHSVVELALQIQALRDAPWPCAPLFQ